jgi:hypothetical protein
LIALAHRSRGEVDRHRAPVLGPQHLTAHPVLAPGAQRVGERRLLVRQRGAVDPRVVDQRVELLAPEVARPEAQYLRGGGVDQDDLALGVDADHALAGGAQDHLGLPLLPGEFGLGVQGAGQVPYDQHEQFVPGVGGVRVGVGGAAVLQVGAGHLDGELGAVGAPGDHPGRLGAAVVAGVGAAHRAGDAAGVEGGQQVEQPPPDQRGARCLESLQRYGVGVDHSSVGVHQQQRVWKGVEYCREASSASGWPAAHETRPP